MHAADITEARALHARIWAEKGGQREVRYYPCQFGSTHWTRMLEPIK